MSDTDYRSLIREIVAFGGNFGDPVAGVLGREPFSRLTLPLRGTAQERLLLIEVLCWLAVAADNGGYQEALRSYRNRTHRLVLPSRGVGPTSVFRAVEAFHASESDFHAALQAVYEQVVLPDFDSLCREGRQLEEPS